MHYKDARTALAQTSKLRDANPLDQSDEFKAFLLACRLGDLPKCQECISQGVNINGRDNFDYTPLIIQINNKSSSYPGANAERNTFQGERCIYNALNNRIRNLLLQYDFSKTSDPLVYWSSHISSLLTRTTPWTSDITLTSGTRSFPLHKFLLASRTHVFRDKLQAQPAMSSWTLDGDIPVEAIHIALRQMYLDDLPGGVVPPSSSVGSGSEKRQEGGKEQEHEHEHEHEPERKDTGGEDVWRGLDEISEQLGLEHAWDADSARNRRLARQRFLDEEERALKQLREFFQSKILGNKMVVEADHVDHVRWTYGDNPAFADVLLRADEEAYVGQEDGDGDGDGDGSIKNTPDKYWSRRRRHAVLYPVHKAMLLRSEYFEKMFSGDFLESRRAEHLRIITVDVSPPVLELVLTYLYVENPIIPLSHALDVLYAADMLFLDALKTKAAQAISTLGNQNTTTTTITSSSSSSDIPHDDRTHAHNSRPPHPPTNHHHILPDKNEQSPPQILEPINIYDVVHAAWDLRVRRLEEFAARYLASRLEDYIDDPDFHDLILESAQRIHKREETDSIELLDDIRHYLSERFRLRFADAQLDRMMTVGEEEEEEEEDDAQDSELEESPGMTAVADPTLPPDKDDSAEQDPFASDAINYQLLVDKIDGMLETLKLSA
ncbi:hypothetical protein E4U43_002406 [Claviceps pusilla]|uniref:BTB domain-containing protein n=1 Tax=Claviceps pusilla TaxID=123648 RepID=A0A9P7N695_9HYPO|nr:hypothetical protein E4U43_002406 [Claviceps pusilla]